jgi:hypothetical protein
VEQGRVGPTVEEMNKFPRQNPRTVLLT